MSALKEAATIVDQVRAQRLIAGDVDTAIRLADLSRHLRDETEFLDGIERHGLPVTDRSYPAGVCLGWLLRFDPHVRELRRLRGLPIPEDVTL